jgi:NAD(P)-dependent dehydrogenase (short-subunit alcohol dehydrogenase family)
MATWFVTGAARGLGHEIAIRALQAGANVVAGVRSLAQAEAAYAAVPEFADRVLPVALDVTDDRQAAAAVQAAISRFGRIDVLVNNAGRGLIGAVEETSAAEVEAVFATNVFGLVVEPDSFRTDFLDGSSLHATARELPDYASTVGRVRQAAAANNHGQINDPVKGAVAIYTAVTAANPPSRLQVGPDAVAMVENKLAHVREELETWRAVASSTLFTDGATSVTAAP